MKEWFCTRIGTISEVLEECESLENSGYKVEQIVYAENQYQIFYSRTKRNKQ